MANAPTVSFVRRFWPGILDPWSSLAMTTDGQGQKGQMEIFPIIAAGNSRLGAKQKGAFNASNLTNKMKKIVFQLFHIGI